MKNNRDKAISVTLGYEGGYTNNAADPGGPTNWGITIYDAKKYWKADATAADVRAMPKSVAIDIYSSKYWITPFYNCDNLDAGVDLVVFDFGVNSGPSRAKKYLDLSIGGTSAETINKFCDYRQSFLESLKTFPVFGKGWTARVKNVRSVALEMASTASTMPSTATEKPADASKQPTSYPSSGLLSLFIKIILSLFKRN